MQIALLSGLIAVLILAVLRTLIAMSQLSDKITALTADVATLGADVETALGNAATPADLQALDQAHTDLQAVIARLQPTG